MTTSRNAHLHAVPVVLAVNPALDADLAAALVREFALRYPGTIIRDPYDLRCNLVIEPYLERLKKAATDEVLIKQVRTNHLATICAAINARKRNASESGPVLVIDGLRLPVNHKNVAEVQQVIDAIVADSERGRWWPRRPWRCAPTSPSWRRRSSSSRPS
jgi:hypothetical protein